MTFKPLANALLLRSLPLFLLIGLVGATAHASPITYTIHFTMTNGTQTPTGSFAFDSATNLFSSFTVRWNGISLNLTNAANGIVAVGPCATTATDTLDLFYGLTTNCASPSGRIWIAQSLGGAEPTFFNMGTGIQRVYYEMTVSTSALGPAQARGAMGEFTVSSPPIPEPGTVFLLLGGGLLLALRKRQTQRGPSSNGKRTAPLSAGFPRPESCAHQSELSVLQSSAGSRGPVRPRSGP